MKLIGFKGLLKKSIALVDSIENPYGDYYIIRMRFEQDLSWRPGDHGIFTIPSYTINGNRWRAFSVASVPYEGVLMIGTRTGKTPSSYKQHLINLKQNDVINVRGPFGWFPIKDDTTPIVFVADGVGITPVRASLKQIEHPTEVSRSRDSAENENEREITLIYASSDYYLFGYEIQTIAENNPNIHLLLTNSSEEAQMMLKQYIKRFGNKAYYYVSGSPHMIRSIRKIIKSRVKRSRIITDPYYGYKN